MSDFIPFPRIQGGFLGRDPKSLSTHGLKIEDLRLLTQVHGDVFWHWGAGGVAASKLEGDAWITDQCGVPIAIKTADCVPILLAHPAGVIAAIHAGWRGTQLKILNKVLHHLEHQWNLNLQEIKMAVGPAISAKNYEVSEELAVLFSEKEFGPVVSPGVRGKFLLDLKQANANLALNCGLRPQQIEISEVCTFEQPDRYYSYRYAQKTGRVESGRNYSWIRMF